MGLLKEHVYRSLSDFGNSFIMPKDYEKFGIDAILDDLQEHGFTCVIEKRECSDNYFGSETLTQKQKRKRKEKPLDVIYLIRDIRRYTYE